MNGGTEIPNGITGNLYLPNGTPAVNAAVTLYPVNYVPGNDSVTLNTVQTDAHGKFQFLQVTPGQYNVLGRVGLTSLDKRMAKAGAASVDSLFSFADSISLSDGQEIPPDTLKKAASLTGTVQLQIQDDPRTAIIRLLGTNYYTNVDSNGAFTLPHLAQGTYPLEVIVSLPSYTPLFKEVTLLAGQNDTLSQPLVPFYSGIPAVTGLTATPESNGTILIQWNRAKYSNLQSYLLYGDPASNLPPGTLLSATTDTSYAYTVYDTTARYPFGDTSSHTFKFQVKILNQSNGTGPVFGSVTTTIHPPYPFVSSGRWHQALAHAPFSPRYGHQLFVFNNALWVGGGGGDSFSNDLWTSPDGVNWQKVSDSLPGSIVVFQDKMWSISSVVNSNQVVQGLSVSNSVDGIHWTTVSSLAPVSGFNYPQYYPYTPAVNFQNKLWILGGTDVGISQPLENINSSPDGVTWTALNPSAGNVTAEVANDFRVSFDQFDQGFSSATNVTAFNGKLWMVGGYNFISGTANPFAWSSADGQNWSNASTPFLPRYDHSLTVHNGLLWVIGGSVLGGSGSSSTGQVVDAEVWSSADGNSWLQVDTQAPFGGRQQQAAVSFQNRLWVIGGKDSQGNVLNDVWYYQ